VSNFFSNEKLTDGINDLNSNLKIKIYLFYHNTSMSNTENYQSQITALVAAKADPAQQFKLAAALIKTVKEDHSGKDNLEKRYAALEAIHAQIAEKGADAKALKKFKDALQLLKMDLHDRPELKNIERGDYRNDSSYLIYYVAAAAVVAGGAYVYLKNQKKWISRDLPFNW